MTAKTIQITKLLRLLLGIIVPNLKAPVFLNVFSSWFLQLRQITLFTFLCVHLSMRSELCIEMSLLTHLRHHNVPLVNTTTVTWKVRFSRNILPENIKLITTAIFLQFEEIHFSTQICFLFKTMRVMLVKRDLLLNAWKPKTTFQTQF